MQEITKSSVVYTLTKEDLVAYQLFRRRHSATVRNDQQSSLISYTFAMFLILIGLCGVFMPHSSLWASLGLATSGSVLMAAYILYYSKHGHLSRVRKMAEGFVSERENPGLLGEHTLEVDEEGITHVTAYNRSRYAWGALGRIETEAGYTYFYVGTQIFVIHHEAIISGDFKAVLAQIGRHHQPDRTIAP